MVSARWCLPFRLPCAVLLPASRVWLLTRVGSRLLNGVHHAFPDAPGGRVDDPPQTDIVVRIEEQLQVGEGVLDLLALVEADAADDAVGEVLPAEGILEDARLGVGAVEHGGERVGVGREDAAGGLRDEVALLELVAAAGVNDLVAA